MRTYSDNACILIMLQDYVKKEDSLTELVLKEELIF